MRPNLFYVCRADDTTLLPIATLHREEKVPFVCPACREPVTIVHPRRGGPHARHKQASACSTVSPESEAHKGRKIQIRDRLSELISGGRKILTFVGADGQGPPPFYVDFTFLDGVSVDTEVPLMGLRFDVGIRSPTRVLLGIEVRDTHAVSDEKARLLNRLGVAWVEVAATVDNPDASGIFTCLKRSF